MKTLIARFMKWAVRGAESERRSQGFDEGEYCSLDTCRRSAVVDGGVWKRTCGAGIYDGPSRLQLFARVPVGRTIVISAEETRTVDAIKCQVEGITPIPAAEQRLVTAGRDLQNGCALQDYGITDHSTIHVLPRLGAAVVPKQEARA